MKINNTFFVLDTETGGVDPNNASLMEVAGVVIKDFKIVKTYSSLVKSEDGSYKCNDFARKMHGISNEMCNLSGKLPIQIVKDLKAIRDEYFDGNPMTIIAHNASFDISFIKKMFVDAGCVLTSNNNDNEYDYNKIFSRNAIDTATMALLLRSQDKLPFDRCSLDNILLYYKVNIQEQARHSALGDAMMTVKAFANMYNDMFTIKAKNRQYDISSFETDFDDEKKLKSKNNGKDF